jgi:hypothetical protein
MKKQIQSKANKYFSIFIFLGIFIFAITISAQPIAKITHTTGDSVNLTEISTYAITINVFGNDRIIQLKSIKSMIRTDFKDVFDVTLNSGEKMTGTSVSVVEGKWELGDYKNSFKKIKTFEIFSVVEESSWAKPSGYVAEVVEKDGTVSEVYGLKMYFSYSNDSPFIDLPVNPGCGTTLIPFKEIISITNIITTRNSKKGTITFIDGNVLDAEICTDVDLDDVKGVTQSGKYKKEFKKISKILFNQDKYIDPKSKYKWGKKLGNLKATITCTSGYQTNLTHVFLYSSPERSYSKANLKLEIQMGEADNSVDLNKIVEIAKVNNKKDEAIMKTKSGASVRVKLRWASIRYLGGKNEEGLFYFVSLEDLNKINFTY